MTRASLSYAELLTRCTAWTATDMLWASSSNRESDGGHVVHEALDRQCKTGEVAIKADDPQVLTLFEHASAWLREHRTPGLRSEVAFAWDWVNDTGRELPTKGPRDYSQKTATEIPGTADLVTMGIDEEGPFVWVGDWKTHLGPPGAERKNARAQLAALALAAARTYNVDRAKVVALHVDETGVDDQSEAWTLDAFDLGAVASTLYEALAGPPSEPRPGEHCTARYCPAIASCPATREAMVQLVPDVALVKQWRYVPADVASSPDAAAWALRIRPMLRKAMEQVDATISGMVKDGPLVTSTGEKIEQTYRTVNRVNAAALEQLARELGATDEQIAGCVRPSTESAGVRISGGAAKKGRAA